VRVTTSRRARELARQKADRQAARRAAMLRRRRRRQVAVAGTVAAVLVIVLAAVLFTRGDDDPAAAPAPTATPTATPSPAPASPTSPPKTSKVGACTYTETADQLTRGGGLPAPAATVATGPATATIVTSAGTVTAELFAAKAPCTVTAFRQLAVRNFFDNTPCHRLVKSNIFVLQCGDPTGSGRGGPGFQYANENTKGARYGKGTLAMANSGPGTNGSQFFIVYADPNAEGRAALAENYTVFGRVTGGLPVVEQIAAKGVEGGTPDGTPVAKPTIRDLRITG
jgi:peptidyl-prolyl cis-trans isomerase B (cyclophilin B)